jgi:hypothetical protein
VVEEYYDEYQVEDYLGDGRTWAFRETYNPETGEWELYCWEVEDE